MDLSFPTRKLKGSIRRINQKVSKLDINPENFTVFGVSKNEGVSITGKDIGKNLNTYYYFKGQKFAYNPYRVNIGSIGLSDKSFEGLMSSAYVIFETTNDINDEFLLLYLKSPLGLNLIKWYGNRGGVRSALRFKDLEKIDFPDLTYQEQTNAIEIIKNKQSIVDELNIELEHQIVLIDKLRQSILQEAVQGKLTVEWRENNSDIEPASELLERIKKEKEQLIAEKKLKKEKPLPKITKVETPYELPSGWEWCRFRDCANIASNLVKPENFSDYPHVAPDVIEKNTGKLLGYRTIREDGVTSFKHLFYSGQILYSKIRPNLNKLVIVDFSGLCSADMYPINSFVFTDYLFKYMLSSSFLKQSVKTDTRVAMPKINQTELNKIIVAIPPLKEQKLIVTRLNELMTHCDQLEKHVEDSKLQAELLIQAVLQEVFNPEKKENSDDVVKELFPDLETITEVANLQQAMIIQKTELGLGSGRGKVYAQKTSANLKNIFGVDIPYTFEKSHHGEFSYQLSEDLDKNPYLHKVKTEFGEIYQVKNNKQHEVLNALNKPENASFIKSIDELLKVYQKDLIKGSTDRIELLNTVCKAIKDTKSLLGNIIYKYLEEWEIRQGAYKTKADKFTKSETFAMITLIKELGWDKKL